MSRSLTMPDCCSPSGATSSLYLVSPSSLRSLGNVIARSSAYGSPLCRPRIIIAQMTSLLNTLKCPQRLVKFVGYPSDSPTLPYAETTSKKTDHTEKALGNQHFEPRISCRRAGFEILTGSSGFMILLLSAAQMQNTPINTYQRSKLS